MNKTIKGIIGWGLWCSLLLLQGGCSVSYSLDKSSDSISASIDSLTSLSSISRSSCGADGQSTLQGIESFYEEDVAAMTVVYVSADKGSVSFQRQVTAIARQHGISNWEQDGGTFVGLGRGLRRAGVPKEAIAVLPFLEGIVSNEQYPQVLAGYQR